MQSECGSRTDTCPTCNQRVKLKDFEMHAKLHTMTQASTRTQAAQPRTAAELARLRDAVWARAGFGDDDPSTSPRAASPVAAALPRAASPAAMQVVPDREPDRFCNDTLCVYAWLKLARSSCARRA